MRKCQSGGGGWAREVEEGLGEVGAAGEVAGGGGGEEGGGGREGKRKMEWREGGYILAKPLIGKRSIARMLTFHFCIFRIHIVTSLLNLPRVTFHLKQRSN
jgi:hypothetical protein